MSHAMSVRSIVSKLSDVIERVLGSRIDALMAAFKDHKTQVEELEDRCEVEMMRYASCGRGDACSPIRLPKSPFAMADDGRGAGWRYIRVVQVTCLYIAMHPASWR